MHAKCPYPNCQRLFEIPAEEANKRGICPYCARAISYRSAAVSEQVERQLARRLEQHKDRSRLSPAPQSLPLLSAVLEDVRSLWNVGSIFRTADGAGFTCLYLCGITGCPPRKEITKTGLGAEESVYWQYHASTLSVLPALRAAGAQIVALEHTLDSVALFQAISAQALRKPLCLVVGNEVTGISAEALSLCHIVCHLPMKGVKESLNVSVAFGIAAYAIAELTPAASLPVR